MADDKIILTKEGRAKLEEEYRRLIDVDRVEVLQELELARSHGDLSENADYDAARNRQAEIEARINEIEHMMDIAVDGDNKSSAGDDAVKMGTEFEYVEIATKEKFSGKIVGSIESNPLAPFPLISIESPVGRALSGHKVGDVIRVVVDEPYEIEITSIKNQK